MNATTDLGVSVGPSLPPRAFARLERDVLFRFAKWDPQVGDVAALAPFPLRLTRAVWRTLATAAEALAAECLVAEAHLLANPDALAALGLPRTLRRALADRATPLTPSLARVMRFDFHPTASGWRVSEVNADVPGGYAEASGFTAAMAAACGGTTCGDPLSALVDAALPRLSGDGVVALVHATSYADDRQVADGIGRALAARGVASVPVAPDGVLWSGGAASVAVGDRRVPVCGLWRFFPIEWMPSLARGVDWPRFVRGGAVPACNPGSAAVLQSKRWPIAARELALPTWRALMPDTLSVDSSNRSNRAYVLKPVWGRIGDGVGIEGVTDTKALRSARRASWWWPRAWVAQRRFESVPLEGPDGPLHACLGVYTVDGRAAGVYGRVSPRALVDGGAREVAVLLEHGGDA